MCPRISAKTVTKVFFNIGLYLLKKKQLGCTACLGEKND